MPMRLSLLLLLLCHLAFGQPTARLFSFQSSTCDEESDPYRLRTRIINKDLANGILTIQIGATATCCVKFIPKITFKNGIQDLDFEETGEACECTCCYEFIYQISGVSDEKLKITFRGKEIELSTEKYKTYPVQFKILNGDTINYIDKYGFKQGIWVFSRDSIKVKIFSEYADDRSIRYVRLYPNGQIERETISEKISFVADGQPHFEHADFNKYVEYFESGQKRKECYNESKVHNNSYENGKCREWNEKGELIYEGVYRK
jgi:hypothetical protein